MSADEHGYDSRYDERVVCPKCRYPYQLLDWGCALHRFTCGDTPVPQADQDRIVANAAAHGHSIRFERRV